MARWRGRVALVTGGSSGIGEALVRRLSAAGMKVATCARRVQKIAALADACAPGVVMPLRADLRVLEDISSTFARIREEWGGVDVLINNAGLGHATPLLSDAKDAPEQWREMLEVNVLALCVCTREAVADMRARGDDGHVIHLNSMSGHRAVPQGGVYAATKCAVTSLTTNLRMELSELSSNIRVSALSPGYVETGFHEIFYGNREAAEERYSRHKVLEPRDIADLACTVLAAPPHVEIHDVLVRPKQQQN